MNHFSCENFEARGRCALSQEIAADVEAIALIVKVPNNSIVLINLDSND